MRERDSGVPGSHEAAGLSADAALLGFARTLWRRRWLVLAAVAAVTGPAGLVVQSLQPSYRAEVKLMVDPRAASPAVRASDYAGPPDSEAIQGEIEVLQSRDLAHAAVRSLRLTEDPVFNLALQPLSAQARVKARVERTVAALRGHEMTPAGSEAAPTASAEDVAVEEFRKHLEVAAAGHSRVIALTLTAGSAERAAELANSYADLYLARDLGSRLAAADSLGARLGERIATAQAELRAAEQKADDFRRQAGLGREGGTSPALQQLTELNSRLVAARAAQVQAEARLAEADAGHQAGILLDVQRSPAMAQLRAQEAEVARRVADLTKALGGKHPQLINARSELAEVQRKIAAEVARAVDGLRQDAAAARANAVALRDAVAGLQRKIDAEDAAEVQARELERDAVARRQVLEMLLARAKDAQEAEGVRSTDAKLISRADPPLEPFFPRKGLLLAVAGMAGMALGVFLALLAEAVRSGLRSAEEVESELGVRGLALVPQTRRPIESLAWQQGSAFAESLRGLAVELEPTAPAGRIVVVTSPSPGEGKTTLAAALARSVALEGRSVLLIDADLRRPRMHATFGTRTGPGLSDILAGGIALEDAIVPDEGSPLAVLPAGTSPASPIRLLGSAALVTLLDEARARYGLVVVDTPPLLPVADARLVGRLADQVLLVVRWGRTKRAAARLALRHLAQAGAPLAGVVVSRVDTRYHRTYGYADSAAYTPAAMRCYAR